MVLQAVAGDMQSLLSLPFTPSTYHVVESGLVTTIPVADLLKPDKVRRRPTEQSVKPIKTRKLKNVADEVHFVFIVVIFFLFEVHEIGELMKALGWFLGPKVRPGSSWKSSTSVDLTKSA